MQHSTAAPPATYRSTIPDLTEWQKELAREFLDAAKAHGLAPQLSNCFQTPRLGFDLRASRATRSFLKSLLKAGWSICEINHDTDLTVQMLEARAIDKPDRLWLFKPVFSGGRLIHGGSSGLRLAITDHQRPARQMHFPDAKFGKLPVNDILEGCSVDVNVGLLAGWSDCKVPDRIDVVYTWVDGTDPAWLKKRAAHSPQDPSSDATHRTRFEHNDELLYSLRSLFRYFVGLGTVYLVTDAQKPAFLDEFQGRVQLIDHNDIMDDSVARPTFNSHAIESCLHRIDGLKPQYLYFNDDVLLAKPTCSKDFFDLAGRSKCFFSRRGVIPKGAITERTLAANAAAMNLRALLAERFNHSIRKKFQHVPVAINTEVMKEIERVFAGEFKILRQNRFRSKTDLSPCGSLYQHYAMMKGHAKASKIQYRYYSTATKLLWLKLMKLSYESDFKRPKVYCINAAGDRRLNIWSAYWMSRQLDALYPPATTASSTHSAFEKFRYTTAQRVISLRKRVQRSVQRRLNRKIRSQ